MFVEALGVSDLGRIISILLVMFVCVNAFSQSKEKFVAIEGIVKDIKGDRLIGVTVLVQNSQNGAITDIDGQFRIEHYLSGKKVKLQFNYLGMQPQIIETDGSKYLNVVLQEDVNAINEVVVTGYMTIDRKKLTSAVSSVKASEVMVQGNSSIDRMLEGRIADLTVMNNSGEVGIVPRIRIRGTSTLIGNREPLWVVDGIVVTDPVQISPEELNDPDYINRVGNAISGINPQDIDRIDVLKDASATALYGVKAANGVIVVTTKKGREGNAQISYNMNLGLRTRPRYTDRSVNLMNSQERVNFSKDLIANHHSYESNASLIGYEGLINELYRGQISQSQFNERVAMLETLNTDWFDILSQDALSHQHTVSVSGGTEKVRYYGSLGYMKDNDVLRNNNNERYTGALNLNINLTDRLSASFNMNANVGNRFYNQGEISPIDYAYNTSRAITPYNSEGGYAYYNKINGLNAYRYNILNELENGSVTQDNLSATLTSNVDYKIISWLTAKAIFSYTASRADIESYWGDNTYKVATMRLSDYGVMAPTGPDSYSVCPFGGELSKNYMRTNSYTARLQLDGSKYFGKNEEHNVALNLGFELSSSDYNAYNTIERGYYKDRGKSFIHGIDLNDYPKYQQWLSNEGRPTLTESLSNVLSTYASLSYSYKNWVTFNANTRLDGSNKFGSRSNEKLLPIWSVSTSYNIWEHIGNPFSKVVDQIALRLSYGYQGNMLDDQSSRMVINKKPMDPHYGELISGVGTYPNPDLRWEKTGSSNFGLDMSFFQGAVQLGSSIYYKVTTDAFLNKTISTVNGLTNYVVNSGTIRNWGYSIDLTASPVQNRNFRWTLSTSFSKVFNRMESTPSGDLYDYTEFLAGTALIEGLPIGTFYSYKFMGLNPKDGGPLFDDKENDMASLIGKSKYDVFTTVLTPSGTREPTVQGSLNNTFRYKSVHASLNLTYSFGNKVRLFRLYNNGIAFNPEENIHKDLINRWRKPGDEKYTNIPGLINTNSAAADKYMAHWSRLTNEDIPQFAMNAWDMYNYANHRVVSGNYLKCSNFSISYDVPQDKILRYGISALSITASVSNVFTIASSKLKGQSPIQSGFSTIQLPERPTYTLGMNLTF